MIVTGADDELSARRPQASADVARVLPGDGSVPEDRAPHRGDIAALQRATGLVTASVLSAALIVGYTLLPLRGGRWWIGVVAGVACIGLGAVATVRRLRRLSTSSAPVADALEAVALITTMLVVGFSAMYFAIASDAGQFSGLATRLDAVYFTLTTLSTVGFGDVVPAGQLARSLVSAQIVVDLAVLGVVLRAFTGVARRRRDELG